MLLCVVGKNCSCGYKDVTKPPILSLKPAIFTKNSPCPFLEFNIILTIKLTQCTDYEVLKVLQKEGQFFRKRHRGIKAMKRVQISYRYSSSADFWTNKDVIFIVK